jgi:hypothetical protein
MNDSNRLIADVRENQKPKPRLGADMMPGQ